MQRQVGNKSQLLTCSSDRIGNAIHPNQWPYHGTGLRRRSPLAKLMAKRLVISLLSQISCLANHGILNECIALFVSRIPKEACTRLSGALAHMRLYQDKKEEGGGRKVKKNSSVLALHTEVAKIKGPLKLWDLHYLSGAYSLRHHHA